jgi:1-acyl-sn-glycerol-3-phosphate acyltransferase
VSDQPEVRIRGWAWWIARVLITPVFRWGYRVRATGLEHVPRSGPTLFVANHISMWDPPMIGYALMARRRIYFMAKRELFVLPGTGPVFRGFGAFPIDRGGADRSAIRTAREILARGDALLMFPEGTRHTSGSPGPAWPGAGTLAQADDVCVVPVRITGSNRRLGPVEVAIGPPLDVSDVLQGSRSERNQAIADRMMQAISQLGAAPPGGARV